MLRTARRRNGPAGLVTATLAAGAALACAAALGAVAGSVVGPGPARAAGPALVIVLDASGSMNGRTPSGRTRLEEAKAAIRTVVSSLPAGAPVGLRVYGSTVGSAAADKAAGCRDSRQVVPVGPLDAARFTAAVDAVAARGWTPVGYALQEAGKDLAGADERTVVLVSDGLDTCGDPEPCAVARTLAAAGVSTRIHAVGFGVGADQATRTQLACVAAAGRGTYRDASDAASLAAAVQAPVAVALRGFTPAGTRITGTADPVTAPALAGDGAGRSDALVPGQTKYYAVQVEEGQQVEARATLGNDRPGTVPAQVCKGALVVDLLTPRLDPPSGRDGNGRETFDGRGSATAVLRTTNATGERWTSPGGPDAAGTWWVRATLEKGTCPTDPALPVRPYPLQVAVTVSGGPGPQAVPAAVPLGGGTALTNAPALPADGAPVTDGVAPGETRWWRLQVREGAEAHLRTAVGGVPWSGEPCRADLQARLVNSDNEYVTSDGDSFDGRQPVAQRLDSSTAGAIGTDKAGTNQQPGAWYLRLSLAQGTCTSGQAIPARRYPVRIVAEVRDFAPPSSASPTPTPTPTASGSGSPLARPGDEDRSVLPWVLGGLGALLLVAGAVALGLFLLVRHQRAATAGGPGGVGGGGASAGPPVPRPTAPLPTTPLPDAPGSWAGPPRPAPPGPGTAGPPGSGPAAPPPG